MGSTCRVAVTAGPRPSPAVVPAEGTGSGTGSVSLRESLHAWSLLSMRGEVNQLLLAFVFAFLGDRVRRREGRAVVTLLKRGRFTGSPSPVHEGGCPLQQGPHPGLRTVRCPCPARKRPVQAKLRVCSRPPGLAPPPQLRLRPPGVRCSQGSGPWCQMGGGPLRFKAAGGSKHCESASSPWPTPVQPALPGTSGVPIRPGPMPHKGNGAGPAPRLWVAASSQRSGSIFFSVLHTRPI